MPTWQRTTQALPGLAKFAARHLPLLIFISINFKVLHTVKIRPLIMDALDYCSQAGGLGRSSLAEAAPAAAGIIVNRTFAELAVGDSRRSCARHPR